MNRRSFLRGTLLSVAGTTALVQLATPAEALALIPSHATVLGHPEPELFYRTSADSPEIYMRRNDGGFVCVGICTRLEMRQSVLNMESWSGEAVLIPGLKRGQLFFEGQR
jgi:hypothetical protein